MIIMIISKPVMFLLLRTLVLASTSIGLTPEEEAYLTKKGN